MKKFRQVKHRYIYSPKTTNPTETNTKFNMKAWQKKWERNYQRQLRSGRFIKEDGIC